MCHLYSTQTTTMMEQICNTRLYLITKAETKRLAHLVCLQLSKSLADYIRFNTAVLIVDAVLQVLELDIYSPISWTSKDQKPDRTTTVRSNRKNAFSSRRLNRSSRTPLLIRPVEKLEKKDTTMNSPLRDFSKRLPDFKLQSRHPRRLNLSRAPASLPPTLPLPQLPPLPWPSASMSAQRPPVHPLTATRRLRPLTPIIALPPTPPPSPPLLAIRNRTLVPSLSTSLSSVFLDSFESNEDEADDVELEMDWRTMLELFPTPRTLNETVGITDEDGPRSMGSGI